ncbi:hypothetical protein BCR36DRAFT_411859 [Piromyces finnis]|uniref:ABC transporter domain-containing protein n=1 Tax=Piromyces finnis TaxID=1754191 RepID=A0A1Y1VAK6_9FUNG|nr:hypothetical protein BCR36DRAFT_411859 [Piromyces finnis]|eukprot:ORX51393.1 hypothetical protein BCR36DRAFT_411859 [Piromyces finnis]
MTYKQLKVLLWRNVILKKRSIISTLLEIILPTIFIFFLAMSTSNHEEKYIINPIENETPNSYENADVFYDYYTGLPTFDFIFSSDFNKEKQDLFLYNFINNKFFNNKTLIENDNEILKEKYFNTSKIFLDNPQFNSNITNKYNLKNLIAINNFNDKKNYFGIVFNSLTKYSISFYNEKSDELENSLKVEDNINDDDDDDDDDIRYNDVEDAFDEILKINNKIVRKSYHKLGIVQALVNNAIFKTLTNTTNNSQNIHIYSKTMDSLGISTKFKTNIIHNDVPFVMLFFYIPCICSLLNHLVIEKESRIKESLVIIGLKRSTFWISWGIIYGVIVIITSIIVTTAMYISNLFIHVHWSITIFILITYGLTCCCISFILSTLLKKSKTANVVGVMVIITFFLIYLLFFVIRTKEIIWILNCLISPFCFLSIFTKIIDMEKEHHSITLGDVFTDEYLSKNFSALVFILVLYFIMALYLDMVLPQGNNIYKKWHFFVTDIFHNKNKKLDKNVYNRNYNNPFVQNDPGNLNRAVEVCNIGKRFKVKNEKYEVLNNISFNAYYDEIFAILGHNGAGKTTLMNIMTGIQSASHGKVFYDNIPISGNETEICKQFGYCPQFNAFNDSLTVGEHVKLYAGIKEINVNVKDILKKIDLIEKKDNYPIQLSGGQKRKLSVILALLGSPKFVFLDEPTTGLDPYSRKKVWELLIENKKGCVTFITTHYMDEADFLSDRKMIISNGDITCLGTSLFLKNIFNMNYSLDIQSIDDKDVSLVDNLIKNINQNFLKSKKTAKTNIEVTDDKNGVSKECYITTYLLPMTYSKSFKDIFKELNLLIKDENNSIENYSLTAPTLEEIFIRLESHDPNNRKLQRIMNKSTVYINVENENLQTIDQILNKKTKYQPNAIHQIWTIIKLRIKLFLKNKIFVIVYTLLPFLIIISCVFIEKKIISEIIDPQTFNSLDIKPSIYNKAQWFKSSLSSGQASDIINIIEKQSKLPFKAIDYNNTLTISSKKLTSDLNYIGGFEGIGNGQDLQFTIYKNTTYSYTESIAVNLLYNALLNYHHLNETISVSFKPFSYDIMKSLYNNDNIIEMLNILPELMKSLLEPILLTAISMAISLSISIFGPLTVKERENGITHQLFLNGTKPINYWYAVIISDSICVIVPIFLISIVCFIEGISIFKINMIAYTLFMTIIWTVASLLHQYILCHFFKRYERVSTLSIIINPVLCIIVSICSVLVLIASINESYIKDKTLIENLSIRHLIFSAIILILYTPISLDKSQIMEYLNTKEVLDIQANKDLSQQEKRNMIGKIYSEKATPPLFNVLLENYSLILAVVIILLLILIFAYILFFLERKKEKHHKRNKDYLPAERELLDKKLEEGPKDVYNEWKRIKQDLNNKHSNNNNIAMKIFELNKDFKIPISKIQKRKKDNKKNENKKGLLIHHNNTTDKGEMDNRYIYDKKTKSYIYRAIDDISYGVNEGECLGLLGPNGAGKTTTISMITGLLSHTHGSIKYGDKDLNDSDLSKLSLGYCSQIDALWKPLMVKETIEFYLNICGYPVEDIPQYTKTLTEICGIEKHINKRVSAISGGTKRKLSLIIAICSSPKYLILDEPSAGMDPFTRRYIWKVITQLKKTHEIASILTTHSTEEAEALCERIAILIKGRLVCVDSPRSIKMNHCNSYTLEVFTIHPKQFEEFVRKNNIFGLGPNEKYTLETSISYQKYYVEMKTENIPDVFSFMEKAKEKYLISQYNFGQYSLEQIFINYINNSKYN